MAGDECSVLQELYLLDTGSYKLQCVARSTKLVDSISYSPHSRLFLVLWQLRERSYPDSDQQFEAYCCSGQRYSAFQDPKTALRPPVAHVSGNRAALAHSTTFSLWDLEEGQLLGTAGPGFDIDWYDSRRALIAADGACSKLIFSPAQSSTLYLYHAESLELMHALLPEHGCICQGLTLGVYGPHSALVCGVYGLLLLHPIVKQDIYKQSVELLQLKAGASSYTVVTLPWSRWHEAPVPALCSPCGTYCCRFVKHVPEIQVHDLRSGQVVLRRMIGPAVWGQPDAELHYDATMHWGSCGNKLMVAMCASSSARAPFFREQVFVLDFY